LAVIDKKDFKLLRNIKKIGNIEVKKQFLCNSILMCCMFKLERLASEISYNYSKEK
jgi:hypothetical protein